MAQMESSQLDMARKIEKKGISEIPAESRPAYHLSSPVEWMILEEQMVFILVS